MLKKSVLIAMVLSSSTLFLACSKESVKPSPAPQPVLSFQDFIAAERAQGTKSDSPSPSDSLLAKAGDQTQVPASQEPANPNSSNESVKTDESAKKEETCDENCKKRRQEFRYVVYVGKQVYCYWKEKASSGVDFEKLAKELEARITSKTSETEYVLVLRDWAAAFQDGHVNVMPKADTSFLEVFTAAVRLRTFSAATAQEKVFVSETEKNIGNIAVGDEVIAVNDKPIKDALDEIERTTSGSTSRMRRFGGVRKLVDATGIEKGSEPLKLKIRKSTGEFTVDIPRNVEVTPTASEAKPTETTGAELLKVTILPGQIGYLRIDGFVGTQIRFLLKQAMHNLRNTKGLILDLRRNGGGDQSADEILARLSAKEIERYRFSSGLSPYLVAHRPDLLNQKEIVGTNSTDWIPLLVKPAQDDTYHNKPVIAMTSPNCFSACDTFVAALKFHKLALIVGEGTGGGTGSPLVFDLEVSGHKFRYSVFKGLTPDNKPIEGVGTLPDIEILPDPADLVSKADTQLVRTIDVMSQQLRGPQPPVTAASEAAAQQILRGGDIWHQGFDLSPTRSEMKALQMLTNADELLN